MGIKVKHILENIQPEKLKGLKIATIGLLIAIFGFIIFIVGLDIIGRIVLFCGFAVGFTGIAVHVYTLLKILRRDK